MVDEIRPIVLRAVEALQHFGAAGTSPLHLRRLVGLWPHRHELSTDDADRVVLMLITRCTACSRPVELTPGVTDDRVWRHVDPPPHPHAPAPEHNGHGDAGGGSDGD
jgi:hypothetical protein